MKNVLTALFISLFMVGSAMAFQVGDQVTFRACMPVGTKAVVVSVRERSLGTIYTVRTENNVHLSVTKNCLEAVPTTEVTPTFPPKSFELLIGKSNRYMCTLDKGN